MSRRATEDQITAIFADTGADLRELRRLRSRIADIHDEVQGQEEPDVITDATSKAFDLVLVLAEEGLLKTRHLGAGGDDRGRLLALIEANIDYLRAAAKAFSK